MNQQLSTQKDSGIRMNALVPTSIHDALQLADIMAKAGLIPKHLRGKPGDCLLVIMQAQRWGMDAMSVAQCTSVVHDRLCYEGKLVAAALYAMGAIEGRLEYDFSGSGEGRKVVVSGKPRGASKVQTVEGTVAGWKTNNDQWKSQPDDMLTYRGTRQWARRYAPEALLGVYTPDEMDEPEVVQATVVTQRQAIEQKPAELPGYTDEAFAEKLVEWGGLVESGKVTPERIIATAATKTKLTDDQKARIMKLGAEDVQPPSQVDTSDCWPPEEGEQA